ncbi:MAG: IS3 family transposase [Roseiarcus sp.]
MRDRIQRISLAHRHDGYRRIAAQLRREGHIVNAKRVLRLMRDAHFPLEASPNLLSHPGPFEMRQCCRTRPVTPPWRRASAARPARTWRARGRWRSPRG